MQQLAVRRLGVAERLFEPGAEFLLAPGKSGSPSWRTDIAITRNLLIGQRQRRRAGSEPPMPIDRPAQGLLQQQPWFPTQFHAGT